MKFSEYIKESSIKESAPRPPGPEPMGKVNAQDRNWVESSLKYWKDQEKKHPRKKIIKYNIKWFEYWLDQLNQGK